jgi:glycosyltransferase involved in cell wall biosynthesis
VDVFESDLNRSPFELGRVAKWIREQNFDVMHSHMSRAHTFGVLMKMMTGVRVVATAHTCSLQLHWRMNDRVIANSKSTANFQRRINRVSPAKLKTIYCFTDLDRFENVKPADVKIVRNEMRLRDDDFVVGTVGDVLARKGQLYLFRAMEEIISQVPNFKLVLVGRFNRDESYVKKLRQLQRRQPLLNRVKWLGLRNNVQDFMAAFDLCVVPSVEEPLGLVALESLAVGTPVVASDTGGLPEIVKPHTNGLLVPPKQPKELAAAVIAMAKDAEARKRFGESGRKFVQETFSPDLLTQQIEQVYLELQSVPKRAAG